MYQSMIYLKKMFVSLLYNYILALEAEESVRKLAKHNKA